MMHLIAKRLDSGQQPRHPPPPLHLPALPATSFQPLRMCRYALIAERMSQNQWARSANGT